LHNKGFAQQRTVDKAKSAHEAKLSSIKANGPVNKLNGTIQSMRILADYIRQSDPQMQNIAAQIEEIATKFTNKLTPHMQQLQNSMLQSANANAPQQQQPQQQP
jgi:hypothetical protein